EAGDRHPSDPAAGATGVGRLGLDDKPGLTVHEPVPPQGGAPGPRAGPGHPGHHADGPGGRAEAPDDVLRVEEPLAAPQERVQCHDASRAASSPTGPSAWAQGTSTISANCSRYPRGSPDARAAPAISLMASRKA